MIARLAVLPGHEGQAVPDQVHDAGLHNRLRENRHDGLWKALEAVDHGNQDVVDATQLELVDDLEPVLGPFGLLDPEPEHILLAVRIELQGHIDGLVLHQALIADFDAQRVKESYRIDRFQRPALPLSHLIEDGIGDPADEIG
ncbi:hypothetical protein ACVWW1_000555 [Bradyrhizobium sp. JR3.5]